MTYVKHSVISVLLIVIMIWGYGITWVEPVCAATVNNENIVTDVRNPSNGVIKYNVTVPAGEKIDYSVELTPDKKSGTIDRVYGTWRNTTRKTVKKTVTVNVKYLSNKYRIQAVYSKERLNRETVYKDVDTATSSLKKTTYTSKLAWDAAKLGKGKKEWTYRYQYLPYKNGYKKYLQVFDKNGKQIRNTIKQTVPISKITKLIKEMKTR